MAAIAKHYHLWNQDAAVLVRFADASTYSSSLEQTLNSLTVHLDLVNSGKSTWFKHVSFDADKPDCFALVFTSSFLGRKIVFGTD